MSSYAPWDRRPSPLATDGARSLASGRWQRQWRFTLKEIRESLYDRRTIITLVIVPVVLYPLLAIGLRQYFVIQDVARGPREYHLGVASHEDAAWLSTILEIRRSGRSRLDPMGLGEDRPHLVMRMVGDAAQAIRDGEVDLVFQFTQPVESRFIRAPEEEVKVDCEVVYDRASPSAVAAVDYVERLVEAANRRVLALRLADRGVRQRPDPVRLTRQPLEGPAHTLGGSLLVIIPLILIMMTSTGAVYPAIDLTAGERERGTLEILIAAPVARFPLLAAKYVAVVLIAMITAAVNLGMMIVTLSALGMWNVVFGEQGFSLLLLLRMFALMPLFACFFASVLLAITSFARSFKEAQAYLIPVILVSLVPGFAALTPGLELRGLITVVPLLNIVLLGRDLLTRSANPPQAWIAVVSTAAYAVGALFVAARIFGAEAVLYGSQETWGDLWRRPSQPRRSASLAMASFCLAVVFPVYFFAGGFLSLLQEWSIPARLVYTSIATSLVFAALPIGLAVWNRIPLGDGFLWKRPKWTSLLAAILLGVSMWTAAHEFLVILHQWGLVTISASRWSLAQELLRQWRAAPLPTVLFAMAIVPGICEELFFRGFLLQSLRQRMGAVRSVLTAAVLFGGFHLITSDALAVERFVPTAFLGVVLGALCVRGGSVTSSMLAHALHNGFLVTVAYYQPWLAERGIGLEEQAHLPPSWLAMAAVAAWMAVLLLVIPTPRARARHLGAVSDAG